MQNLNNFDKMQQRQNMPQMPQMSAKKHTPQQVPPEGKKPEQAAQSSAKSEQWLFKIRRYKVSKYEKFFYIAFIIILLIFTLVGYIFIIKDDMKARNQIQEGYENAIKSSKVQEYRAKQAQRQRELAKKRRLKELGIDGPVEPYHKNDLLNEKLREQELAEEQESLQSQDLTDYAKELADYKAKLEEVKAEEARLDAEVRAQAEAKAKTDAEIKARLGIKE